MKRVERLFRLILLLRDGRVLTGQHLSEKLGVSSRTVYRDISDLADSGVPIDGQSGVGFLLRDERQLPTVIFTDDELQALALGAEMVRTWSDREVGDASDNAIRKLETVLPRNLKAKIYLDGIKVDGLPMPEDNSENLKMVRASIEAGEKLVLSYLSPGNVVNRRTIRPLLLGCWYGVWSVGAWCELRGEFRTFQADRIVRVEKTAESFEHSAGCGHHAYLTSHTRLGLSRQQNGGPTHDKSRPMDRSRSSPPTPTALETMTTL
jgi:predicted DNA-binding transcriptional regulator YafY